MVQFRATSRKVPLGHIWCPARQPRTFCWNERRTFVQLGKPWIAFYAYAVFDMTLILRLSCSYHLCLLIESIVGFCWIKLDIYREIQCKKFIVFLCFLCIFGEMGHVVRVFSQFEKLSILVFAHFLFLQYRLNIFISGTMVKNHWLSSIEIQNLGIPKYGRKLVFVG